MENIIHKQILNLAQEEQTLSLPKGAQFLCAQNQFENLTIWYHCDLEETEIEPRTIIIIPTEYEHKYPPNILEYLSTVLLQNGELVFHIFEKYEG